MIIDTDTDEEAVAPAIDEPVEQDQPIVEEQDGQEVSGTDEPINPLAMSDEDILAMDAPEGSESESESESESGPENASDKNVVADTTENVIPDVSDDDLAKLFGPIKAGGQTIQLQSIDEVVGLVQKGADYHRKTEELAAHRKTLATLERAGIRTEDLNYLVELHNKNPEAIAKLVADAELDPFDIDVDSESTKNYQPQQHVPNEKDLALDATISELKKSETWPELIDVVGNQWDDASRNQAAENPQVLERLNFHMEKGIYPVIAGEVTRLRAIGQLNGLTDIEAYSQVGMALEEQGGFNQVLSEQDQREFMTRFGGDSVPGDTRQPATPVVTYRPGQSSDPNLDARRRAASPTRAASSRRNQASNQINPLALSDEQFEKQFSAHLR